MKKNQDYKRKNQPIRPKYTTTEIIYLPIWTARNNEIYLPDKVNPILRPEKPLEYIQF